MCRVSLRLDQPVSLSAYASCGTDDGTPSCQVLLSQPGSESAKSLLELVPAIEAKSTSQSSPTLNTRESTRDSTKENLLLLRLRLREAS